MNKQKEQRRKALRHADATLSVRQFTESGGDWGMRPGASIKPPIAIALAGASHFLRAPGGGKEK